MRGLNYIVPPTLLLGAALLQACGHPPIDDTRADRRLFPPKGVIQGSVSYTGPRPCSQNGHIVGDLVILVFDRRNPPPPGGLANTAVNFAVVAGDVLFLNEYHNTNADLYCPKDHGFSDTITVGSPFTIAPMEAGSYVIQAFYDYTGTFLPTFKIRNLPRLGDVVGGYVDAQDAAQHAGDVNYQPIYLPVDIGTPVIPPGGLAPGAIPSFNMPNEGFVRANIQVTVGLQLPIPRPYFYLANPADTGRTGDFADSSDNDWRDPITRVPKTPHPHPGSTETDPDHMPVVTMTQDWQVEAPPSVNIQSNVDEQQNSFVKVQLKAGVPNTPIKRLTGTAGELDIARDKTKPFLFQLPSGPPSMLTWANNSATIPETALVKQVWPLVVFAKLQDDPPGADPYSTNPQQIIAQGSFVNNDGTHPDPIVIIQGLTVFQDSLFNTSRFGPGVPTSPASSDAVTDHVTVLVRPSVICFDADAIEAGGVLVTPHSKGTIAGSSPPTPGDIIDVTLVRANVGKQVRDVRFACLPKGRYEVNAVYPTGQAWTIPNEAGACSSGEGLTDFGGLTCLTKPRDVIYSQGARAVLEITDAADPTFCKTHAVPVECCPNKAVDPATGQCCGEGRTLVNGQCSP